MPPFDKHKVECCPHRLNNFNKFIFHVKSFSGSLVTHSVDYMSFLPFISLKSVNFVFLNNCSRSFLSNLAHDLWPQYPSTRNCRIRHVPPLLACVAAALRSGENNDRKQCPSVFDYTHLCWHFILSQVEVKVLMLLFKNLKMCLVTGIYFGSACLRSAQTSF